jgi:hypothetical protein
MSFRMKEAKPLRNKTSRNASRSIDEHQIKFQAPGCAPSAIAGTGAPATQLRTRPHGRAQPREFWRLGIAQGRPGGSCWPNAERAAWREQSDGDLAMGHAVTRTTRSWRDRARGKIWLVRLDPAVGWQFEKARPCALVSAPEMRNQLRTVMRPFCIPR